MTPKINFICVGAQKSGTTSLHDILKQHPEVYLPRVKETHFFDDDSNYQNGLDWYYKTFFEGYAGEKICGECTPEYMFFPHVPENIYKDLGGDVKLVFLLRDPVSRGVSHFQMSQKRTYETLPIEEAIDQEESRIKGDYFDKVHFSYFTRGYYSEQIKRYLKYFPKENMLFIRFEEDFLKHRQRTMDEVCAFLGIDGRELAVDVKSHVGKQPRYKWLPKFIYKPRAMREFLSFLPFPIRRRIIKFGYNAALKEKNQNALSKDLDTRLRAQYQKEISELEDLIEKDLSSWKVKS